MKFFFKFLIIFYTIFTSNLYSNTSEIPNEKVFDNPKKEVTTVEAKKNKEHAEMNIKVNKLSIQEIKGYNIGEGKTQYFIPKEEKENKLLRSLINNIDNQYLVFETKDQLSQYLNKNKKARNKRNLTNPIQYEVMQDENQTMLTVNSDKDVYILDNKNNVYFGKALNSSRATDFAAQLIFDYIDIKYIKYHFPNNQRYRLSELKTKPLAEIFANGNLEYGNLNMWLNNGWKYNSVTINRGGYIYTKKLGYDTDLKRDMERNGLEYVTSNTDPMDKVSVVLNKTQNYKFIGGDAIDYSAINFQHLTGYSSYDITTQLYMRGNWITSSSVMGSGHKIQITPKNIDFMNDLGIVTDMEVNVLKNNLSDTSTTINLNDKLEINYTRAESDIISIGNYIRGRSSEAYLFQVLKRDYLKNFYIEGNDSLNIDYKTNDKQPPITFSNFDVGQSRKRTVSSYLKIALPWGNYSVRKYNINVSLVEPDVLILGLGTKVNDSEYIYDRKRQTFIEFFNRSPYSLLDHVIIPCGYVHFFETADMSTVKISGIGYVDFLSDNYNNGQITVSIKNGELKLSRNMNYLNAINTTFYLVGINSSTRKKFALKVCVIAPRIDTTQKYHKIKIDSRYLMGSGEKKIPLNDSTYSKFIKQEIDVPKNFIGNITKVNDYVTDGIAGDQKTISLSNNIHLETNIDSMGYNRLNNWSLVFSDTIPSKIENIMCLSGLETYYSNVKLIIEKVTSSDTRIKNGRGTIDLTDATIEQEYRFNTNNLKNQNIQIKLQEGDFIEAKSIFDNSNLINKIKVNSSELLDIYRDNDIEFRIDELTGDIIFKRLNKNPIDPKILNIEYFYNSCILGSFQLEISANIPPTIKLEGIDTFDFGSLLPGSSQTLNGQFTISSLSQTVSRVDIPKEAQLIKQETMEKIPLTITSSTQKEGDNVKGSISVTANVPKEATAGTYSGTIDLTVTIE